MPKFDLSAVRATADGAFVTTHYGFIGFGGEGVEIFPSEKLEAKDLKEAVAGFLAYAERAKATGRSMEVSIRLARGERAPAGFRKLEEARRNRLHLNLKDAAGSQADLEALRNPPNVVITPEPVLTPEVLVEAFATELTPEGEQLVMPGCERKPTDKRAQLSLWG